MRIDQRLANWLARRKAKRTLCAYLKVTATIPDTALDYMGFYTAVLHQDTTAYRLWLAWRTACQS